MNIKYLLLSVVGITIYCAKPSFSQVATFIGGGGDNYFTNNLNWSGGSAPVANADLVITSGKIMIVNADYTCNTITLNSGASFYCSDNHFLTITDAIIDENGRRAVEISSALQIRSSIELKESSGTFTDARDGHIYKWKQIGSQIWMAENLAYLPSVTTPDNGSTSVPLYYVQEYYGTQVSDAKVTGNYTTYGTLYNWTAATTGCPDGWHLPTDDEWKELEKTLGMSQAQADLPDWRGIDQATQMKSTGGWNNNGNGTNTSGFNGLPGGYRNRDSGTFGGSGDWGWWWTATEGTSPNSWGRAFTSSNSTVYRASGGVKDYGFSVRCVMN